MTQKEIQEGDKLIAELQKVESEIKELYNMNPFFLNKSIEICIKKLERKKLVNKIKWYNKLKK